MTFQPWKQAFNNLPNQFYRNINTKNDSSDSASSSFNCSKMKNGDNEVSGPSSVSNLNILSPSSASHPFDLNSDSQPHYQSPTTNNALTQIENDQPVQSNSKNSLNGTKFSIFSQLLNLNKINAFDNLLLNASMSLDDDEFSSDKRQGIKKLMEQAISDEAKQQIAFILEKISALRPAEKLLLYLKMPGGHAEVDPLKQSQNPLGSRSEISHTINWVRSHLEQDDKVSIPKQEVYEDYVSFCGKINIKPLSTADFGKVMKQVFPDIRPRRLGTRGHSRYCYAAMRKATKLNVPHLPDISIRETSVKKSNSISDNSDNETTWKVIKSWSENLLGTHFESMNDLAEHISHNNLNLASISSTSKQVLQKKLMQREMKEKKRNNNQSIRRRRKKQRRASTTSSPEHTPEYYNNNNNTASIQIKQEKETDGSAIENNDDHSENSSDVPMNLSNSEQSRRIKNEQAISTNSLQPCTSSQYLDNETIKNKLKNKLLPLAVENDPKPEENQYVFCKKVRQAQQMKMSAAANQISTVTVTSNSYMNIGQQPGAMSAPSYNQTAPQVQSILQPSLEPPQTESAAIKASNKRKQRRDLIQLMKRARHANEKMDDGTLADSQAESNEREGDLKEDFILPRERFISICNMDRNALDTYLNNSEENSQDLELLQYFGEDKNNKNAECIEEDLGPMTTSVPILENYQLNFNENNTNTNNTSTSSKCDKQNAEKIMQIRSMLEERCNPIPNNDSVIKNLLMKNPQTQQQPQQQTDPTNLYQTSPMAGNLSTQKSHDDQQMMANFQMHSVPVNNLMVDKTVPQSPNTRRKNFSFVPIPTQSTRAKNINLNPAFRNNNGNQPTSPFVSPRVTPVSGKHPVNQQSLNVRSPNVSIDTSKNIPLLGVNNNTAFCRPTLFKMEPTSAPPSPSMAPQNHFNFSPQSQQQQQFQFNTQNMNQHQGTPAGNYNYPIESRSQSVPPHCSNNLYGGNGNAPFNNYNSACSSMAVTPVPSDYQEFADTNILEIFNNEQPPLSSTIKMETNDDVISDLLDNDLLNQNSNTSESDTLLSGAMRPRFNSISRSVPCTPLPFNSNNNYVHPNGNMNASVPNTPITNASNPFRYSPELQRTRDFLINGFNNNINHNNNNVINKHLSKSHDTSAIDELDSSLLNNL